MPSIDTAWQGVRTIMPKFQKTARAHGATRVRLYAQALTLSAVGGSSGICYGMSAEWIIALRTGGTSAITTGFTMAADSKKMRSDDFGRIGRDLHHQQFSRHMDDDALPVVGGDQFLRAGLRRTGTTDFHQSFSRMTKAANHMIGQSAYYMINTPNHAMAARTTNGVCMFFDPNLGEAQFPTRQNFKTFVVAWLGESRIIRAYAGRRGGKLAPGKKHKTLHLSIDRYQ